MTKIYIFNEGLEYVRHSYNRGPDPEYPKKVMDSWSGWPDSWTGRFDYLNSACYYPGNQKFYLFAGDEYVRHSYGRGPDPDYPKKVTEAWTGWPDRWTGPFNPIHIALYYPGNEKFYIFCGDEYVRHSYDQGPDPDYPKKIAEVWSGWPDSWRGRTYLNTAFYYPDNDKFYIFSGDEYVRHSYGQGPDPDYPKKIIDCWTGWPQTWVPPFLEFPGGYMSAVTYYPGL